jgi:hypothetical protein
VYCALLAVGVYVSMRRQEARRGVPLQPPSAAESLRRARRILGVWTFYALIHLWSIEWSDETISVGERTRFFLALFGFGDALGP